MQPRSGDGATIDVSRAWPPACSSRPCCPIGDRPVRGPGSGTEHRRRGAGGVPAVARHRYQLHAERLRLGYDHARLNRQPRYADTGYGWLHACGLRSTVDDAAAGRR